jgi:AIPR protein
MLSVVGSFGREFNSPRLHQRPCYQFNTKPAYCGFCRFRRPIVNSINSATRSAVNLDPPNTGALNQCGPVGLATPTRSIRSTSSAAGHRMTTRSISLLLVLRSAAALPRMTTCSIRCSPTGKKFVIEDYQIVNGCQTSHVLSEHADKADKSVMVPVRLIGTQDETVINTIIRATNRQTEVKEDQFFALQRLPEGGGTVLPEHTDTQYPRTLCSVMTPGDFLTIR